MRETCRYKVVDWPLQGFPNFAISRNS